MIVGTIIDFQFKAVATESFTDSISGEVNKSHLTAFLGTFYGRLSLVSIIIQMFFAGKIIRKFGVGSIILFLPIALLFGSIALFAYFSIISAVLLRGEEGSFSRFRILSCISVIGSLIVLIKIQIIKAGKTR